MTVIHFESMIYYIYLDYTLEVYPRIFYVGKGTQTRVAKKTRNNYWINIANKYGWRREVILSTKDENYALDLEIFNIKLYKTFETDWTDKSGFGANLTRGGEGMSGFKFSEETKCKMSIAQTGKKRSPEAHLKWQSANKNKPSPNKGNKASLELKKKLSIAHIGKQGKKRIFTVAEEVKIYEEYQCNVDLTIKQIATKYSVSRDTIIRAFNRVRCK